MALKQTTDATFEQEVIGNSKLTVVDFWAPWCGPCKQFLPVFEDVSNENENVNFVKMNIDENPETPVKLGVRGIPTVIIFKDGEVVDAKSGFMPHKELQEWINSKA